MKVTTGSSKRAGGKVLDELCVCVCVCMCLCICVCVCVDRVRVDKS